MRASTEDFSFSREEKDSRREEAIGIGEIEYDTEGGSGEWIETVGGVGTGRGGGERQPSFP